jgi:hypothetical protein
MRNPFRKAPPPSKEEQYYHTDLPDEDINALRIAMAMVYLRIMEGEPRDHDVDSQIVEAAASLWVSDIEAEWSKSSKEPGSAWTCGVLVGYRLATVATSLMVASGTLTINQDEPEATIPITGMSDGILH